MRKNQVVEAAIDAAKRGFQPVPILGGSKAPRITGWTDLRWSNDEVGLGKVSREFETWFDLGHTNIGVLAGAVSGGLIDVDLDSPTSLILKDYFLPRTRARSGTGRRPSTHYWYIAKPGTARSTRKFVDASGATLVEYRSTGSQTIIPPSTHPTDGAYSWEGQPWGGDAGPTEIDGSVLAVQTSLLALCTLLVDSWPAPGGRNDAFLALAGGLLRMGEGIHPYWRKNAEIVIEGIASAIADEDGSKSRVIETVHPTVRRLERGKKVAGFGKLGEIIGQDVSKQARVILAEIESLAGLPPRTSGSFTVAEAARVLAQGDASPETVSAPDTDDYIAPGATDDFFQKMAGNRPEIVKPKSRDSLEDDPLGDEYDPLEDRAATWEPLDLEPYLTGQVQQVEPSVLDRADGQSLLYPGRLNMLYGPSEAAKSWLSMFTCVQVLKKGERVVYIDFEDEPVNAIQRMKMLGATNDDLRNGFRYVHPEDPISTMQRTRWGDIRETPRGVLNQTVFKALLDEHDPSLIVADGMTVIYGLHGLDSNDSVQTDVITSWLKTLTRNGRSTVIIVDHTPKNPQRGTLPIGSQHKVAMVQGALLQTYPVKQPMPGAVGEVEIIVLKDRPGQVRAIAEKSGEKAQLAARFLMDSTHDDRVLASLEPPSSETTVEGTRVEVDFRNSAAAERLDRKREEKDLILECFGGDLDLTLTIPQLAEMIGDGMVRGSQNQVLRKSVYDLVDGGELCRKGKGRATRFALAYSIESS